MTLKEYIKTLKKFAKENPDALELQVITAKDQEGNGFFEIYFEEPSLGVFEGEEFSTIEDEDFTEYYDYEDINAVCVN